MIRASISLVPSGAQGRVPFILCRMNDGMVKIVAMFFRTSSMILAVLVAGPALDVRSGTNCPSGEAIAASLPLCYLRMAEAGDVAWIDLAAPEPASPCPAGASASCRHQRDRGSPSDHPGRMRRNASPVILSFVAPAVPQATEFALPPDLFSTTPTPTPSAGNEAPRFKQIIRGAQPCAPNVLVNVGENATSSSLGGFFLRAAEVARHPLERIDSAVRLLLAGHQLAIHVVAAPHERRLAAIIRHLGDDLRYFLEVVRQNLEFVRESASLRASNSKRMVGGSKLTARFDDGSKDFDQALQDRVGGADVLGELRQRALANIRRKAITVWTIVRRSSSVRLELAVLSTSDLSSRCKRAVVCSRAKPRHHDSSCTRAAAFPGDQRNDLLQIVGKLRLVVERSPSPPSAGAKRPASRGLP